MLNENTPENKMNHQILAQSPMDLFTGNGNQEIAFKYKIITGRT
jgi:hypothetical protein